MRLFLSLSLALSSASAAFAAATPPSLEWSGLSASVQQQLLKLDPSTYTVFPLTNASASLDKRAPPNNLWGVQTRCKTANCFALTFDDGPHTQHESIANQINAAGYKATFFVNGANFGCIYDPVNVRRLRAAYNQGHDICSHTWSHPNLATLNAAQVRRQEDLMQEAFWRILGAVPRCIRAPFGSTNAAVTKSLNDRGYVVHGWTHDSGDTQGASVQSQLQRFRNASPSQQINMLQHETYDRIQQVVPESLRILRQRGFQNVRGVGSTYGYNAYFVRGGPQGPRDASWTCAGKPRPGQA